VYRVPNPIPRSDGDKNKYKDVLTKVRLPLLHVEPTLTVVVLQNYLAERKNKKRNDGTTMKANSLHGTFLIITWYACADSMTLLLSIQYNNISNAKITIVVIL